MRWNRFTKTAECAHSSTISVVHGGLERVVCEECGDVTVKHRSVISGDVSRDHFARNQDELFLKKLLALAAKEDEESGDAGGQIGGGRHDVRQAAGQ